MLNISTGHYPKGGTSKVAGQVTALTFDSSGKTLWAGDDKVSDCTVLQIKMCIKPLLFVYFRCTVLNHCVVLEIPDRYDYLHIYFPLVQ